MRKEVEQHPAVEHAGYLFEMAFYWKDRETNQLIQAFNSSDFERRERDYVEEFVRSLSNSL